MFVDRLPDCRQVLWRIVRDGRTGGVAALAIPALGLIATDYVLTGRWDEADQLADESNELCSRNGYELLAWSTRQIKSQLAAYRGDEETTRRIAAEMLRMGRAAAGPSGALLLEPGAS